MKNVSTIGRQMGPFISGLIKSAKQVGRQQTPYHKFGKICTLCRLYLALISTFNILFKGIQNINEPDSLFFSVPERGNDQPSFDIEPRAPYPNDVTCMRSIENGCLS